MILKDIIPVKIILPIHTNLTYQLDLREVLIMYLLPVFLRLVVDAVEDVCSPHLPGLTLCMCGIY